MSKIITVYNYFSFSTILFHFSTFWGQFDLINRDCWVLAEVCTHLKTWLSLLWLPEFSPRLSVFLLESQFCLSRIKKRRLEWNRILRVLQSSARLVVSEVGGPCRGISCWKLVWLEDGLEVRLSPLRHHNTDHPSDSSVCHQEKSVGSSSQPTKFTADKESVNTTQVEEERLCQQNETIGPKGPEKQLIHNKNSKEMQ